MAPMCALIAGAGAQQWWSIGTGESYIRSCRCRHVNQNHPCKVYVDKVTVHGIELTPDQLDFTEYIKRCP